MLTITAIPWSMFSSKMLWASPPPRTARGENMDPDGKPVKR